MKKQTDIISTIKNVLAETIGVESEDINDTDDFLDDLHMSPSHLSDFIEKLSSMGIDTSKIELAELKTVDSLIEQLFSEELIE